MGRIPVEAEYLSNPSDVIDEEEEELEESQEDKDSPPKRGGKISAEEEKISKSRQSVQHQPSKSETAVRSSSKMNNILEKVTKEDIMQFAAGAQTNVPIYMNDEQFEMGMMDLDMFAKTQNLSET